ncbi:MAG: homocysteine S-methyltransferase family protein [Candidatus Heimdallarchaeota archaeon]|nr:homocysteine S-methyltransferase family protein [Candidatus Heimdallarchaeota archaeon]MCK4954457.1 homocysteine S-methyltransferase family protein [Candidatus Heimdallarchaeota archaeon]
MVNKSSILELIDERIIILDGALGSLLISQGLPAGMPPEIWNITNPDNIKRIHKEYFDAGSDVVLTNTFGGSRLKLLAHKQGNSIEEYNKKAVELAREVCSNEGYIAGDIGPSGVFLPPVGQATIEDFEENFAEQSQILSDAEVDLFFIETMVDLKEAETAVKVAKSVSNLPIFASITYQKTKKGYYTIMGDSVEQCVNVLERAGADAIGANCTIGSDDMIDLIPQIKQFTQLPIISKPNAGKPQLIQGETVYQASPKEFADDILQMVKSGSCIVGGCCGSNPEFIKEIKQLGI